MTKRQAAVKSNTRKVRNLTIVIFVVGLFAATALTGCSYLAAMKHSGPVLVKSVHQEGYELIRNGQEIFVTLPVNWLSPTLTVGATYDDIVYTDGKDNHIVIDHVITHDEKALEIGEEQHFQNYYYTCASNGMCVTTSSGAEGHPSAKKKK